MLSTVITLGAWGTELEVRGEPTFERDYRGSGWICYGAEARNPKTKTWHPITNEEVAADAEQALCARAENYNPYIEGDLAPPEHLLR
jgi:hypothetical protein